MEGASSERAQGLGLRAQGRTDDDASLTARDVRDLVVHAYVPDATKCMPGAVAFATAPGINPPLGPEPQVLGPAPTGPSK
jgi:hypothetical protein